jgi:hypothetical protein
MVGSFVAINAILRIGAAARTLRRAARPGSYPRWRGRILGSGGGAPRVARVAAPIFGSWLLHVPPGFYASGRSGSLPFAP